MLAVASAKAEQPNEKKLIQIWLERQHDIKSLSADFVQTRSLRSLQSPIRNKGHLWLVKPDLFRWQLGDPPKTVVVRHGRNVDLISPFKRQMRPLDPQEAQRQLGMQGAAMMDTPVAKNYADFISRFDVLSVQSSDDRCEISILPRQDDARKFLEGISLTFKVSDGHLLAFGMRLRSGAAIENEFTQVEINQSIPRSVFEFPVSGYEVLNAKN
ncbi:MAG TPA: outer membrane lipoprotein carrier protein LolA [Chthoniobacterales bacterium]|jgi:outer membrane lipoprotein-sorting protein